MLIVRIKSFRFDYTSASAKIRLISVCETFQNAESNR